MTYCALRVGSLVFCPLTCFQTSQTSNPHRDPHVGPSFIFPKVDIFWGIKWDVFIFICVTSYTFEKCAKSMDGCTTDRFSATCFLQSFLGYNPHNRYLTMVKTMVWCRYFIVQQVYALLRAACGFLVFLPFDMFSNRPDVEPAQVPTCGYLLYVTKGGVFWGIKWDVFIFICVTSYTFEKCAKSTDGCTTDRFIAIPAVADRSSTSRE